MKIDTNAYREAPGCVDTPLSRTWRDKPHRLVYDLCAEIERLRAVNSELCEACEAALEVLEGLTDDGCGPEDVEPWLDAKLHAALAKAKGGTDERD